MPRTTRPVTSSACACSSAMAVMGDLPSFMLWFFCWQVMPTSRLAWLMV
jgi:hypothetical protein